MLISILYLINCQIPESEVEEQIENKINLSFDEYRGNSQTAEEDISKKIINRFIPFNEESLPEDNNTEA